MTLFLPASCARSKGFTLLELLIVLVIIVLGFSVVALNMSSGAGTFEHKSAVRDVVSALRYARGQALMAHREMTVAFDLTANTYKLSGREEIYKIPDSIAVTVVTAQSELTGEGQGNIRFFADGSSTGGRVVLDRGEVSKQIDINWLTGQLEIEDVTRDDRPRRRR
ncbi:GspH/FimT family protein [Candidatus Methylomicrobium oryzae]|jgi:general secretion pathway protein H|uniref:GspH/FimT family protein n=1 Tax=Candidatus Methylomicrobium oryzae TaxID=2802053 RepID=UPI0019210E05|nr:GspH/FimT family protein [Methylomicrobium sp. RS1]MBL1265616.1 GspH/FimT family pseudopilin [Methylomicrobium sp. RS1]